MQSPCSWTSQRCDSVVKSSVNDEAGQYGALSLPGLTDCTTTAACSTSGVRSKSTCATSPISAAKGPCSSSQVSPSADCAQKNPPSSSLSRQNPCSRSSGAVRTVCSPLASTTRSPSVESSSLSPT